VTTKRIVLAVAAGCLASLPALLLQGQDKQPAKVTDAGLKELAVLKDLQTLTLTNTKVTDDGVKALKAALPKCKIVK
jgi:hypothetical protein